MVSCFELFSTELIYEIFDYMSSDEILYAFINLTYRLNDVTHSYPLEIDFRTISRIKFDFVCQHLQPNQVKSIIFSEENIPNQISLFHENFPYFQDKFIHLESIFYTNTKHILLHFPYSVSRLSFECDDIVMNPVNFYIKKVLIRHAKFLTDIKVNYANIFQDINTSFPKLTHLTIAKSVLYTTFDKNFLSSFNLNSTIRNLSSPITHLHIYIMKDNLTGENSIKNFEYLSYCLTHLSLVFSRDIHISFKFLQNYLMKFNKLTHLTIEAAGESDLINGQQWEKFISQTRIIKFNFKFTFKEININFENKIDYLFQSFRSLFWIEEKHWYVAISKENSWSKNIIIYTIPRFRPRFIKYPINKYPPLSTIPFHITEHVFYTSKIDCLLCTLNNSMILSKRFRFTQVRELRLQGSTLNTIDSILSIIDLSHIRKLDVSRILDLTIDKLDELLTRTSCLSHLVLLDFHPLLILPSHIHFLILERKIKSIDIDVFCNVLSCIESVTLMVKSEKIMIKLINRIEHLHNIIFRFPISSSLSDISIKWFEQNSHRFTTKNFTYQYYFKFDTEIHVSLLKTKTELQSTIEIPSARTHTIDWLIYSIFGCSLKNK